MAKYLHLLIFHAIRFDAFSKNVLLLIYHKVIYICFCEFFFYNFYRVWSNEDLSVAKIHDKNAGIIKLSRWKIWKRFFKKLASILLVIIFDKKRNCIENFITNLLDLLNKSRITKRVELKKFHSKGGNNITQWNTIYNICT